MYAFIDFVSEKINEMINYGAVSMTGIASAQKMAGKAGDIMSAPVTVVSNVLGLDKKTQEKRQKFEEKEEKGKKLQDDKKT